jgi:hypothetical protein
MTIPVSKWDGTRLHGYKELPKLCDEDGIIDTDKIDPLLWRMN